MKKKKTAFEIKTSKYETYLLSHEDDSFEKFLGQCKRAMNKLFGYTMSVKYDEWSTQLVKESITYKVPFEDTYYYQTDYIYETYWERLKTTGELVISDGYNCIEFIYGHHVFAGYSIRAYIEYEMVTREEANEYINSI